VSPGFPVSIVVLAGTAIVAPPGAPSFCSTPAFLFRYYEMKILKKKIE